MKLTIDEVQALEEVRKDKLPQAGKPTARFNLGRVKTVTGLETEEAQTLIDNALQDGVLYKAGGYYAFTDIKTPVKDVYDYLMICEDAKNPANSNPDDGEGGEGGTVLIDKKNCPCIKNNTKKDRHESILRLTCLRDAYELREDGSGKKMAEQLTIAISDMQCLLDASEE